MTAEPIDLARYRKPRLVDACHDPAAARAVAQFAAANAHIAAQAERQANAIRKDAITDALLVLVGEAVRAQYRASTAAEIYAKGPEALEQMFLQDALRIARAHAGANDGERRARAVEDGADPEPPRRA